MGAGGTAVVRTQDLTKHFGSLAAVEGVDLEVRRGEVFGFLGPNGAGKTTTIRLLLDFLRIGYLPADLHLEPRYRANDLFAGDLEELFLDHYRQDDP